MWERLAVVAFSALLVAGAPAMAAWMIARHEAAGVGALFLALTSLVMTAVGICCVRALF